MAEAPEAVVGEVHMTDVRVFRHPVHPMLIVFPLGLLTTSLIFDIIYLGTGEGKWTNAAEFLIGAGVIGGLLAAIFGLLDWIVLPKGSRAKTIGLWHGLVNASVMALFIINWFLRLSAPSE